MPNPAPRQVAGGSSAVEGTNPVATTDAPIGSASRQYPVYFEGLPSFIDSNEFAVSTATNTVYWKPLAGVDPNRVRVTAPAAEQLLDVDGASHLTFYGLQFAHTTWLRPAQAGNMQRQGGFRAEPQAAGTTSDGWPIWYVNPGAVGITDASDVTFERDAFRYLGANGIVIGPGTAGDRFVGNSFTSISDSGIFLGSGQNDTAPPDQQNVDTTISDNYFNGMGEDYATDSAITATYPNGLTAAHNLIENVHNIALNIGYIRNLDPDQATPMRNVQILDNRIDATCLVAADCGAIHTKTDFYYSTTPGSVVAQSQISGNYITNVHLNPDQVNTPAARAIYPDDKANNLAITHNEWSDVDLGIGPNDTGPDNVISDNDTGDQSVIAAAGLTGDEQDLPSLNLDRDSIGGCGGPGAPRRHLR